MKNQAIQAPSTWLLLLEGRALLEIGAYLLTMPLLKNLASLPRGDGHPVMVLPGFTASDLSTTFLRNFLQDLGYMPYPWQLGRNWANYDEYMALMRERVRWIHAKHQQEVSLVGWSLGGVYARELAKDLPDKVRQVITLGSPFNGIGRGSSNADWVYEWIWGKSAHDVDADLLGRIRQSPPVPTSALFTRTDGIVSWKACIEAEEAAHLENIEVLSSHCGMGINPMVLLIIAERLSQAQGRWQPFRHRYPRNEDLRAKYKKFSVE